MDNSCGVELPAFALQICIESLILGMSCPQPWLSLVSTAASRGSAGVRGLLPPCRNPSQGTGNMSLADFNLQPSPNDHIGRGYAGWRDLANYIPRCPCMYVYLFRASILTTLGSPSPQGTQLTAVVAILNYLSLDCHLLPSSQSSLGWPAGEAGFSGVPNQQHSSAQWAASKR